MERELIVRVDGEPVETEEDSASVLVYRNGDKIEVVTTVEEMTDAAVSLSNETAIALAEAILTALRPRKGGS